MSRLGLELSIRAPMGASRTGVLAAVAGMAVRPADRNDSMSPALPRQSSAVLVSAVLVSAVLATRKIRSSSS
jgi:hypothetical protein